MIIEFHCALQVTQDESSRTPPETRRSLITSACVNDVTVTPKPSDIDFEFELLLRNINQIMIKGKYKHPSLRG